MTPAHTNEDWDEERQGEGRRELLLMLWSVVLRKWVESECLGTDWCSVFSIHSLSLCPPLTHIVTYVSSTRVFIKEADFILNLYLSTFRKRVYSVFDIVTSVRMWLSAIILLLRPSALQWSHWLQSHLVTPGGTDWCLPSLNIVNYVSIAPNHWLWQIQTQNWILRHAMIEVGQWPSHGAHN